jgi:hypothetical protein
MLVSPGRGVMSQAVHGHRMARRHIAPAGDAKSRPGITPCGLIRDCRFPSSIAAGVTSGEERKGSGLLSSSPVGAKRILRQRQLDPNPKTAER